VGDWEAAEGEFKQVIVLDANYKDVQTRLAEVRARLTESAATAVAMAEAEQAKADAQATATAWEQATAAAAASTATAETLETHYQKGLGYINIGRWEEAKTELEQVFKVAPGYKDVQVKLAEVEAGIAALTPTATLTSTPLPRTRTPTATNTPIPPTNTPKPTPSDTPSPQPPPDTAPGSVLREGDTWQQGGVQVTLYDVWKNPSSITLLFRYCNFIGHDLDLTYADGVNYVLRDNLGHIWPGFLSGVSRMDVVKDGKCINLACYGCFGVLTFDGDLTNPSVTSLTITLTNIGPIRDAKWQIDLNR
jgi:tetratricopeptide (TPR) repeat protein